MKHVAAAVGACAGVLVAMAAAVPALADPPKNPYPDTSRYSKLDFEGFQIPRQPGVWFSTPFGLNCGIWDDGSFGCTGAIPGAPAGTNQVGWFTNDEAPHFDNTNQPRFTAGTSQRVLPPNNYIEYAGTDCATTPDNSVYCSRGYYSKFMISPTNTWVGANQ